VIPNRANRPPRRAPARPGIALLASALILLAGLRTALAFHDSTVDGALLAVSETTAHLVVSEVMTGGASASDEFIEIYNPTSAPLPLEALEVVYVTASGSTITRKASWPAGSAPLAAGAHLMVANSGGSFGSIGDQTYTGGLAATGGSVAIRIIGAATAMDAAGWGNATGSWLEASPAPAVAAGHSIERLPGGAAGSGQDTDQNAADFVDQPAPDPQNTLSNPIVLPTPIASPTPTPTPIGTASPTVSATDTPSATATPATTPSPPSTESPTPTPSALPTPTLAATPPPTPTPAPALTIAQARAMADGITVTVEGVALTDSVFTDGGAYVADASAGIAVLLSGGAFERGSLLRVTGELDDRFSQRTIRADASGVLSLASAPEPSEQEVATGAISEDDEGELVAISGTLTSGPTQLTSAVAFDVDDGSGPVRVVVGTGSGIDLAPWSHGSQVHLRGVIGQRDSSGTGTSGYRLQPRDAADVLLVAAPTPSLSQSATPRATASPSASADPAVISIAAARARPFNSRVSVRGVVTLPSSLTEEGSAAIQDASGAILLRLGDEAGTLRLGEVVEVDATRSTKSGMETLRVVAAPRRLGTQAPPDPRHRMTGALGEPDEAVLVSVSGAVSTAPRRTSADNVYFDVDDGSGPIRVFVAPGAEIDTERLLSGTQVEIVGVLGQETTGRLPDRGYRLWPRQAQDLRIVSQPPGATGGGSSTGGTSGGPDGSRGSGTGTTVTGLVAGGAGQGASVPQQARPRLHLDAAASPQPGHALAAQPVQPSAAPQPGAQPLAASLLLFGGLLLIGSGAATGDPGLPGRILEWIRSRFGGRTGAGDAAADDVPGDEEPPNVGLPRLVPLPVATASDAARRDAARSIREEHERILPPT
jgi:hypothetical protein